MGYLMKNGITSQSIPDEYYVLQVNGRVSSTHRRYEDAIRAGLLHKYQFPQDDIKVREINSTEQDTTSGTVFH
jgi:hypothetical protein